MTLFRSSIVHNHLLSVLSQDDFARLEPHLQRVPLPLHTVLIQAHQPIEHVYFPESGISSTVADTVEGRIEIGLVGREGMVGFPVILGADSTPHTALVQGVGEALRISTVDLRAAIQACPSILLPLLLFTHTLIVQMGQTTYMNVVFNVEARLARCILMTQDRTGGNQVLLTHEFLATMLGVRRPSVTSAAHALEGMGSIRNRRGRIEMRNRALLVELAGDAYQVAEDEYKRVMGLLESRSAWSGATGRTPILRAMAPEIDRPISSRLPTRRRAASPRSG